MTGGQCYPKALRGLFAFRHLFGREKPRPQRQRHVPRRHRIVGADIFAAEVDLISDTFALAGIAGFAGIDGNGVGSFGHEILLSCCPVAVDAAIVAWQAIL